MTPVLIKASEVKVGDQIFWGPGTHPWMPVKRITKRKSRVFQGTCITLWISRTTYRGPMHPDEAVAVRRQP
jgi:hypothetical protein